MENYIFVSYSHQDRRTVQTAIDRLESRGYSIWFDKDIQPGTLWDDVIKERLQKAKVVLMFISAAFIHSEYCRLELKLALDQKIPVIPVYLDGARFRDDLQERLDRIQNLTMNPSSFDECMQSIERHELIRNCRGRFQSSGAGPDRMFYSKSDVIDHITFNSIQDHPVYGNEKRFLRVKLPGEDAFHPHASVKLRPGQIYEFEILIHNNADPSLNPQGTGISHSTRIAVHMPEYVRPSRVSEIMAVLSSVNADPVQIWDSIEIHSEKTLFLKFIPASGIYHNMGKCNGQIVSSSFISDDRGFYVGFNYFDGRVPGGDDYLSRITFRMLAYEESAEIGYTKTVLAENGLPQGHVKRGEVFTVRTEFRNLGSFDYRNVVFEETFPPGMELVPGTTVLTNGAHPDGLRMKDIIHQGGFNTGLYGPHANAIITYQARFTSGSGTAVIEGHVAHDSGQYHYRLPVTVEP